MKRFVLLIFPLFLVFNAFSQNIQRKGSLGVGFRLIDSDSLGGSILVRHIYPNTTATSVGLKVEDIILSIDGNSLQSSSDLGRAVSNFLEGEKTRIAIIRNGEKLNLSGRIIGRPIEPHSSDSEVILGEVPFRGGYIRSFVNKPKGEGPFPAIYFVQGFPCASVNFPRQSSISKMIYDLVDKGYAVFRVEKPGIGEFHNVAPCSTMTFEDELEGFSQGYSELLKLEYIDKENVFLFGMSMGGNVVPILAQVFNPAGTIVYGTVVKPWEDYAIETVRYNSSMLGNNIAETEDDVDKLKNVIWKLYRENQPISNLNSAERQLLIDYLGLNDNNELISRSLDFWKSLNNRNFIKEWAKVNTPVLAMHGEMDINAISAQDARLLTGIVNKTQPGLAKFIMIEKTNHFIAKIETREKEYENFMTGNSYRHASENYNDEVAKKVDNWIKAIESRSNEH